MIRKSKRERNERPNLLRKGKNQRESRNKSWNVIWEFTITLIYYQILRSDIEKIWFCPVEKKDKLRHHPSPESTKKIWMTNYFAKIWKYVFLTIRLCQIWWNIQNPQIIVREGKLMELLPKTNENCTISQIVPIKTCLMKNQHLEVRKKKYSVFFD